MAKKIEIIECSGCKSRFSEYELTDNEGECPDCGLDLRKTPAHRRAPLPVTSLLHAVAR